MAKSKRKNDNYRLNSYLQFGEKVLWTGKPNPWRLITFQDLFMIPFSLIWCGVMYTAFFSTLLTSGWQALFMLVIPHLWVAIWLFPGRFFYSHYSRRRTVYAVTNHRLLILKSSFRGTFKSYHIKQLPVLTLHERRNDTGTIKFSEELKSTSNKQASEPAENDFYDIDNVRDVYDLIQSLQYSRPDMIQKRKHHNSNEQVHPLAYHTEKRLTGRNSAL